MNTRWTNKYGSVQFLEQGLPLESGVSLVVTRARPKAYNTIAATLKKARPDVTLLYLNSRVVSATHKLLVAFRSKLGESGFEELPGGNTPSSGLVGVYALLSACGNVTLYGFGLDNAVGRSHEYHYFKGSNILSDRSTKKNRMNPTRKAYIPTLAKQSRERIPPPLTHHLPAGIRPTHFSLSRV